MLNRELVVGAASLPPRAVLDDLTFVLLLPGCLHEPTGSRQLGLYPKLEAELRQLRPENREVTLLLGGRFGVF
ncbi:MAG: hypothetical protein ACRYG7_02760 [Janthinobacterium lividum]